jgi:hypothetical protein
MNDLKNQQLKLNAYGTIHQLIQFLRSSADQIERDSAKNSELPWSCIWNSSCGFMGDFKVESNDH